MLNEISLCELLKLEVKAKNKHWFISEQMQSET